MINNLKGFVTEVRDLLPFIGRDCLKCFGLTTVLGIGVFCAETFFVLILQGFLQVMGLAKGASLSLPQWYPKSAIGTSAILVAFGLFRCLVYIGKNYYESVVQEVFKRRQRQQMVLSALHFSNTRSSGEWMSYFSNECDRAASALTQMMIGLVNVLLALLFLLVGLKMAWKEMLLALCLLALLGAPFRQMVAYFRATGEGISQQWKGVNQKFMAALKNWAFLQLNNLAPEQNKVIGNHLDLYEHQVKKFRWAVSVQAAVPNFLGLVIISSVTLFSLKYFHTPGAILLGFFYIFLRFVQFAVTASTSCSQVLCHFPALSGVRRVIEGGKKLKLTEGGEDMEVSDLSRPLEKLSLKAVELKFNYPRGDVLFSDLNFELSKGRCLLVTGESGAGKSTLLLLLLGLLRPTGGAVMVNGREIDQVKGDLFASIGHVGPEPFLISGTIRQNLLYGHPDAKRVEESDFERVLKLAKLSSLIDSLPEGLETHLREQTQWSTGQKQRLSLARALLKNPKLLILDECTSNLDELTESDIIEELRSLKQNLATVVISHKKSFDRLADITVNL